jgi:YHS domain-containing protein
MLRLLAFLLLFILVVPILRVLIGVAARALHDLLSGGGAGHGKRQAIGGRLHRDPVCGVYVSEQVAVRRESDGQALYFCSEVCAKRYGRG